MITKNLRRLYEFIGNRKNRNLGKNSYPYAVYIPNGTYAPWITDEDFNIIYKQIANNTLVHKTKCYVIYKLVEETAHLEGDYMEVGVWRGGVGALIAAKSKMENDEGQIYLCDTFEGVVKSSKEDNFYEDGEHADTSEEIVKNLCKRLGLQSIKILKGIFPDDTSDQIESKSIKFCHIDVDVYQGAKEITEWVWPLMPLGGIIVFDDYGFPRTAGVTKYVEEQRKTEGRVVIHNLSGQAIIIKTK